jgi:hypothetical protein
MTTWMDDIEEWIAYFLSLFEVSGSSATGSGTNSSTVATSLSKTQIIFGEQVTDSATVTGGGPTPTGNVDFYISYDSGTSWTKYDTQVLANGSATSDPIAPYTVGTIYFKAKYSGDDYYAPAESDPSSANEHLTVQAPGTVEIWDEINAAYNRYDLLSIKLFFSPRDKDRSPITGSISTGISGNIYISGSFDGYIYLDGSGHLSGSMRKDGTLIRPGTSYVKMDEYGGVCTTLVNWGLIKPLYARVVISAVGNQSGTKGIAIYDASDSPPGQMICEYTWSDNLSRIGAASGWTSFTNDTNMWITPKVKAGSSTEDLRIWAIELQVLYAGSI